MRTEPAKYLSEPCLSEIRTVVTTQIEKELETINSAQELENCFDTNKYQLTELGNAERFADKYRNIVCYVPAWKKWLFWDGKKWCVGANEKIRQLAHKIVKQFYLDAVNEPDMERAKTLVQWGTQSCKSSAITALLKEAAALLPIDPEMLDSDPWLFNCDNFTINIRTMTARRHDRLDFITKISPVTYDTSATAPIFLQTLSRCLSKFSIQYIQRFFGYCLTGSTKEQIINIWHGYGANGKSTILNPIANALGDYAQTTRPETLMVRRDGIPSDLAKLKGARLVNAAEADDGHRLAEAAIKQWTGGDKIQARALYQDWFEFLPEFKILLLTNHKPIIAGIDHAIWRRIRLVPFTVTIPDNEQDKNLPEKLNRELPGILNWMLEGACLWLSDGLGYPKEIREATESYQSEQSIINVFLEDCCVVRADALVEATVLFAAFETWRTAEGHKQITQTKFGRMLAQLGFEKNRLAGLGRTVYRGIDVNES
jgi:putative DNA primase/helicase